MKKLLFILLGLALAAPAFAQNLSPGVLVCNRTFQVSQGAVALTRIIQASGQVISLCGWTINTGAAASTTQFQFGTGTNCGTGTTVLTPAFSLPANFNLVDHPGNANISLPSNNDLCLVTTGAGPTQVLVYYTIQ